MSYYGQFCPVAKAMEVLDERWTLLIIREILSGSTQFNDIRRGVPRMSPALLSKRLRSLQRAGVVEHHTERGAPAYTLTAMGRELSVVVEALGVWGLRWIGELGQEDLDPHLLLWDMRRLIVVGTWPRSRTVLAFEFDDIDDRVSSWWFVVDGDTGDVCDADPGYEVTARVATSLHLLSRIWRAEDSWDDTQLAGRVTLEAPVEVRQGLPGWLGVMKLAELARARATDTARRIRAGPSLSG